MRSPRFALRTLAAVMLMAVAEFEKYLNADIAKWAHVVNVSGARQDR